MNVVEAQITVRSAVVKGPEKLLNTPAVASTTKMTLIKVEKISSVKRVRYLTKLDADVTLDVKRMNDVHRPVHAYNGKKGNFMDFASCARHTTNERTGPVDPMMVHGCAAVNA